MLPGGPAPPDPSSVLQSTAFATLLGQLRSEADFVVIDAPPVLASADTAALAELGAMIEAASAVALARNKRVALSEARSTIRIMLAALRK